MLSSPLRILFISRDPPYPPISGTSLRIWQNVNILKKYGSLAFFTACRWEPTNNSLPKIDLWQHYNVDRPRTRIEQLERKLWWLRPWGHPEADWVYANAAARQLDRFLAEFKPDLVIFEEAWMYRYFSVVRPYPCRTILLEHNIEAPLYEAKHSSDKSLLAKLKLALKLPKIKAIESDFVRQVDCIWVCSDRDAKLLQQLYQPKALVQVVSNGVDIAYYRDVYLKQCPLPKDLDKKNPNILFLGQLSYIPNTQAVDWLINAIYPRLQKVYPDCRLLLVGARPTQGMLTVAKNDPKIIVTGMVSDVRPYLAAADLMVVPLKIGGGTRLKILEAFAAGCPVVSTSKGAEGIAAKNGEHLLIGDDLDEFVSAIARILADPGFGKTLAESAYKLTQEEYSWDAIAQQVDKTMQALFP